jgi:hypothetical protein
LFSHRLDLLPPRAGVLRIAGHRQSGPGSSGHPGIDLRPTDPQRTAAVDPNRVQDQGRHPRCRRTSGLTLNVSESGGGHRGDLRIGKATVEWMPGKTRSYPSADRPHLAVGHRDRRRLASHHPGAAFPRARRPSGAALRGVVGLIEDLVETPAVRSSLLLLSSQHRHIRAPDPFA